MSLAYFERKEGREEGRGGGGEGGEEEGKIFLPTKNTLLLLADFFSHQKIRCIEIKDFAQFKIELASILVLG